MVCSGKLDDLDGRVFRYKDQRVYPCAVCGTDHDAGTLLLCDGLDGRCVSTAHTTCIGLTEVPEGDWFCKSCQERGEHKKDRRLQADAKAAIAAAKKQLGGLPKKKRTLRTKAPLVVIDNQDDGLGLFDDDDEPPVKPPPQPVKKVIPKKKPKPLINEEPVVRPRRAAAQKRKKYSEDFLDDDDFKDASDDEDASDDDSLKPKPKKKKKKKKVTKVRSLDANDDWCANCGDGGDLICCDKCNRAYHLPCAGLDVVPDDDWFCLVCTAQQRADAKTKKNNLKAPRR